MGQSRKIRDSFIIFGITQILVFIICIGIDFLKFGRFDGVISSVYQFLIILKDEFLVIASQIIISLYIGFKILPNSSNPKKDILTISLYFLFGAIFGYLIIMYWV
tara:strand:+ start:3374 stop:3688 length:315 start_codon:yes stop_codon:yes gene_type:complete